MLLQVIDLELSFATGYLRGIYLGKNRLQLFVSSQAIVRDWAYQESKLSCMLRRERKFAVGDCRKSTPLHGHMLQRLTTSSHFPFSPLSLRVQTSHWRESNHS